MYCVSAMHFKDCITKKGIAYGTYREKSQHFSRYRLLLVLLIGFMLCAVLLAAPVAAATLTVAADGSGDYMTINEAVAAAAEGDTILIKPGTYTMTASLNIYTSNLKIIAETQDTVILNLIGTYSFIIRSTGVQLEKLTFKGSQKGMGIYGAGASNCLIKNNKFINIGTFSIDSSNNFITDNIFFNSRTTTGAVNFYTTSANFNTFRNNTVVGAATSGGTGTTDIYLYKGSSNFIENNTFRDGMGEGFKINTGNNTIRNNVIVNNAGAGFFLSNAAADNRIYLNTIINNSVPATVSGGTAPSWVSPSVVGYTYNNTAFSAVLGNYWGSAYSGTDNDGNGIGDSEFELPSGLGTDTAPLMGIWQDGVIHGGPDTLKPTAGFMADSFSGQAPLAVTFTSYLVGPGTVTSYAWDFGDSTTSTDKNPSHTYTTGGIYTVNLTVTGPGGSDSVVKTGFITVTSVGADLTVASCTPFFLAHNTQNSVSTTITNSGVTGAGAFKVRFNVGGNSTDVDVASLGAGNSTTVSVGDAVDRRVNDIIPITVTIDPESAVAESSETNNVLTTNATVIANGYAGHRWEDKQDLVTNRTFLLHGNTIYSFGDSSYGSKSVTWAAGDFPLPEGSTVKEAMLYVPYCWDSSGVALGNVTMTFNGENVPKYAHYREEKGWGSYAGYAYGLFMYNVTAQFSTSGNSANLVYTPYYGVAPPRGMLLLVTYEDANATEKQVFINEGFDMLFAASTYYTTEETATAYAPFTGAGIDMDRVKNASVTSAVSRGSGYGTFIFNGTSSPVYWLSGQGEIGIQTTDITPYLTSDNNTALMQCDDAPFKGIEAFLAILKVEYKVESTVPVAGFTATPTSGVTPLVVTFTDTTKGVPTSWAWDFGDGDSTNATIQNPVHTYTTPRTYAVNLTVTNSLGTDFKTKTDYITVIPALMPVAAFSGTPTSGNTPLTVAFTDLSTNTPTSWVWDFGDGTNATEKNPVHTYTTAGTYTVTLNATNAIGSDDETKTNYITVYNGRTLTVAADGSGDYTTVTAALAAAASGDTIYVKAGSYPESVTLSIPNIIITGESADKVILNGITILGPATGCHVENLRFNGGGSNPIVINAPDCIIRNNIIMNPDVGISVYSSSNTVSQNVIIKPTNDFGGIYISSGSDFNNILENGVYGATGAYAALTSESGRSGLFVNNTFRDSTTGAGLFLYQGADNNTISQNTFANNALAGLIIYSSENSHIYQNNVVGNGMSATTFGADPPSAIYWNSPDSVSYSFNGTSHSAVIGNYYGDYSGPDIDNNGIGNTGYTVPDSLGSDTAPLIGIWQDGAIHGGPDTIRPIAGFSASSFSGESPLAVTFTSWIKGPGTVTSYAWDFNNDGTIDSTDKNPAYTYTTNGTYTVNLTVTGPGGSDNVVKTGYITVGSGAVAPVAAFTTDASSGQVPFTVHFTDTSTGSATGWNWNFGDGSSSNVQNPAHTYLAAGTYSVSLTVTAAGGSNTTVRSDAISVSAAPIANNYFGSIPLATVQSGTVSGGLWSDSYPGFATSASKSFTLPGYTDIKWARLYVVVYDGHMENNYQGNVSIGIDANGDGTYELQKAESFDTTYSFPGNKTAPGTGRVWLNDHLNRVTSDYLMWYDLTDAITSQTVNVQASTAKVNPRFDGRIKTMTLVVAYDDGDADQVRYWVNQGHDTANAKDVSDYGYTGATMYATSALPPGWTSANLTSVYLASIDGTYTFRGSSLTSGTPSGSYFGSDRWDVTGLLSSGENSTLTYVNTGSSYYKIPLALMSVRYPGSAPATLSATSASGIGRNQNGTIGIYLNNSFSPKAGSLTVQLYYNESILSAQAVEVMADGVAPTHLSSPITLAIATAAGIPNGNTWLANVTFRSEQDTAMTSDLGLVLTTLEDLSIPPQDLRGMTRIQNGTFTTGEGIQVQVVGADGNPVIADRIALEGGAVPFSVTNTSSHRFSAVPAGTYQLTVTKAGYISVNTTIHYAAGSVRELTATLVTHAYQPTVILAENGVSLAGMTHTAPEQLNALRNETDQYNLTLNGGGVVSVALEYPMRFQLNQPQVTSTVPVGTEMRNGTFLWTRPLYSTTNATIVVTAVPAGGQSPLGLLLTGGKLGDVLYNGQVTSTDSLYILHYVVGNLKSLPTYDYADITRDGKITSTDALYILHYVVKDVNEYYRVP